jgi:hypothetical protein
MSRPFSGIDATENRFAVTIPRSSKRHSFFGEKAAIVAGNYFSEHWIRQRESQGNRLSLCRLHVPTSRSSCKLHAAWRLQNGSFSWSRTGAERRTESEPKSTEGIRGV